MTGVAGYSGTVEFDQAAIDEAGGPDALFDLILEAGYDNTPSICAQCSGWGRTYSLDAPDEWNAYEIADDTGKVLWSSDGKEAS